MIKNLKIIKKNQYVKLVVFQKKFINADFLKCLNDKSVNEYLDVGKEKQDKKKAIKYFEDRKINGDYYLAIMNENNSLIGTITLRIIKKSLVSIGFMIAKKKYFGTKHSRDSFQMALSFAFKRLKAKKILAKTEKKNASSNFNLMRNGFKLYKKTDKSFFFFKKELK